MRLGPLQKFILLNSLGRKNTSRNVFLNFYKGRKKIPKFDDRINAITKALDKMISHDLMIAEGVKTSEKFFIKNIKLTSKGAKLARKIRGEQQPLPLNRKK